MNGLQNLKGLTLDQYEQARAKAVERVKARIGDRPSRKQFQRELGSLWTVLDGLALIVFVAALVVSSAHIITHMGALSDTSYAVSTNAGIILSEQDYTVIHQLAMIALAEASMLLFMVMHGMNASSRAARGGLWKHLSLPLVLALIAAVFVFVANWQSEIGLLESIMPPVFTVGIGLHLERLIVAGLRRREDLDRRYLAALDVYERSIEDPEKHPDFVALLRQEVWARLISLPSNRDWKEAPAAVRHAAVRREMERDTWAHEDAPALVEAWEPPRPMIAPAGRRSGNIPQELGESVFTPMAQLENAPGIENTIQMFSANGHHK